MYVPYFALLDEGAHDEDIVNESSLTICSDSCTLTPCYYPVIENHVQKLCYAYANGDFPLSSAGSVGSPFLAYMMWKVPIDNDLGRPSSRILMYRHQRGWTRQNFYILPKVC